MSSRSNTRQRGFVWAILSVSTFAGALYATVGLLSLVHRFVDPPHLLDLTLLSIIWGALSLAGVVVGGRLVLGAWLPVRWSALTVAALGIGLSAAVSVALNQWQVERFGYPDPDLVGWTFGLFAVLVGVGTAGFGVFIAPPRARIWPMLATSAGMALTLLIVAVNLPGLADGIERQSWPLAVLIAASGLYAVGVGMLGLRTSVRL